MPRAIGDRGDVALTGLSPLATFSKTDMRRTDLFGFVLWGLAALGGLARSERRWRAP